MCEMWQTPQKHAHDEMRYPPDLHEMYMCAASYRACGREKWQIRPSGIEPRTAMISWALDKASREAPQCKLATVRMLCRAEMRTVNALTSTRSHIQTRQVLEAAYRRAELPNLFAEPSHEEEEEQPQMSRSINNLIDSMTAQTQLMTMLTTTVTALPDGAHYASMMNAFHMAQAANIEAIKGLTEVIATLEMKIDMVHGRLTRDVPTPLLTPTSPRATQDYEEGQDQQPQVVQSVETIVLDDGEDRACPSS